MIALERTMTVIALDTSTDMLCATVGRIDGGAVQLLASRDHLCRRMSNVELTGSLLDALGQAGLTMADMDAVIVGRGPGSFTGVRIGIATAKGIACGLGCALYGASTLDAVAWTAWLAGERGLLGVVGDAMRGEVYPGVYLLDEDGPQRAFAAESVAKVDPCVAAWNERGDRGGLVLSGDGLKKHKARFEKAGFARYLDEALWYPSGEGLLHAAAASGMDGRAASGDPALVLPIYTRLSDAEENERKRLGMAEPPSVATTGTADALADIHLQLRPMSINDVEQVAQLEARAFSGAPHVSWTRRMFEDELAQPGRSWWVAHDRGTIIGFAGGVLAGDDFEIADVVVDDGRRREGIATRLLARLAYDAQMLNAQTASLEVDADNAPARALYGALGFAQAGRRPGYYGSGHDALIMAARLPLLTTNDGALTEPGASIRPWPIEVPPRDAAAGTAFAEAGDLILAIESSCDETAIAVIDAGGRVLSSIVATQIDFHARFGGVVPEIASRKHTEAIVGVFEEALRQAGEALGCGMLVPRDLSAVAVTAGPGLVGALVVGVAFAKGLCVATGLPLIAANHLEGHLFANLFETPDLEPPFVASLVSGGNTMLVHVRAWGDYEILGTTIDDAVGEAFDKVAKALGLGYPGGPIISKLATQGNPRAIAFPRAMMHSRDYRFSLSGLKTAVITYIEGENRAGRPINLPDLAASFQAAVVDVQVAKAVAAVEEYGVPDFCVGGGVAANPALRAAYLEAFGKRGVRVTVPPLSVCGDNAAMIALVALRSYKAGRFQGLSLDADPNAPLGTWSVRG
ncbi:tRNA (adenosine(37)-N6)-threonylcarbamoyltransferase complex transferase subunit TsaD [Coriobacteriales bacterium OH1046]|nr:tRNA (adenosine(37)-N6)-threonylcarbamoyltransferase complex transferase subunit TsaD [Coriobacteriales bacterium OH1046]